MKKTKTVRIGSKTIGGTNPVLCQSMTNTDTADVKATVEQILRLEEAGCDIVRFTVPDMAAAEAIPEIKRNTHIPLVADIHFDYRLAIAACKAGVDKIRINPGNIGAPDRIKAVADACRQRGIPIRIGVNSGSLSKELLHKYGSPTPEALCESALENAGLLEQFGFYDIVLSVKSSDVAVMIRTNRLLSEKTDYPLHLGVTEAGSMQSGVIKSAVGIGSLLCDGIGDTIRVSLTADVCEEIKAAKRILEACGLNSGGIDIISCPTCGRTKIDLIDIVSRLEAAIEKEKLNPSGKIKVAVMGCAVNGPGEAREADIGIAGGKGEAVFFRKGEIQEKISESDIVNRLISEIKLLDESQHKDT